MSNPSSKTMTLADEIVWMTSGMDLRYDRSIEESMLLDIVLKARIAQKLQTSPVETKAPLDSEFEQAMRRAGIHEPLEVYTSNSYRRVGLKSEYKVVLSAIRHSDGQTDISNTLLLEALVAAFNAMLRRSSPEKAGTRPAPLPAGSLCDSPEKTNGEPSPRQCDTKCFEWPKCECGRGMP
jgi:hypothetical protein